MGIERKNRFADEPTGAPAMEEEACAVPPGAATSSDTGPAAAKRLLHEVQELREYAAYYVSARLDSIKASARQAMIWSVLGILGLIVLAAFLVTCTVIAILGIAGGLGVLFGERLWLGYLVTGIVLLLVLGLIVYIALRKVTSGSRERTVEKYARRRQQQEIQFGHNVSDRAAQATASGGPPE